MRATSSNKIIYIYIYTHCRGLWLVPPIRVTVAGTWLDFYQGVTSILQPSHHLGPGLSLSLPIHHCPTAIPSRQCPATVPPPSRHRPATVPLPCHWRLAAFPLPIHHRPKAIPPKSLHRPATAPPPLVTLCLCRCINN